MCSLDPKREAKHSLPANAGSTHVRYGVLALVAMASASAYLTRYCIAVANTTIQGELDISDEQMGWVLGAFSAGYFFFQVPGGWLGNRFGTRPVLAALSTAWSLLTIWTAAVTSLAPLLASRLAFGLAQAGLVPNTAKVIADWMPVHRRGISSATIAASMSLGGVLTMGLTAELIKWMHWRAIFRWYSLVGVVWAIVFYAWFRTRPEQHRGVNRRELELIRNEKTNDEIVGERAGGRSQTEAQGTERHARPSDRDAPRDVSPPPAASASLATSMLLSGTIWAICIQAFFRAAGYQLFVSWFTALLEYDYGLTATQAGKLNMLPLSGVIAGSLVGGVVLDYLLRRTGSKWISRSGLAVVAMTACGILTLAATWTSTAGSFVMVMSCGALFSGLGGPAAWAATIDVGGRDTAVVMGTMNMAGTVGALFMPVALGYMIGDIRESGGDFNLVIYFVAAIYFAGAISWLAVDPNASPTESRDT